MNDSIQDADIKLIKKGLSKKDIQDATDFAVKVVAGTHMMQWSLHHSDKPIIEYFRENAEVILNDLDLKIKVELAHKKLDKIMKRIAKRNKKNGMARRL